MVEDRSSSQCSAGEKPQIATMPVKQIPKVKTRFQRSIQEDYLYSHHNDDVYYYEQRPPHWKN